MDRTLSTSRAAVILLTCNFIIALASCGDPALADAVQALGPEARGVRIGELHRPGQPCLLCHDGGEASEFTLAGTVYADALSAKPIDGVDVIVIDSKGHVHKTTTNCAGNFFVRPNQFTPNYPIWVSMRAGSVLRDMETASYREGSCAGCHYDPKGPGSAGHVYLVEDPETEMPPPSQCP